MENITVRRVKDWASAKQELLGLTGWWIFRGQRDANWRLQTSLERAVSGEFLLTVEDYMLREIKRRAFHYLSTEKLPGDEEPLEWFALMQHHGAPTRLLDWTRSPYVAAFFALAYADPDEDSDDHCAVWALGAKWCRERGTQVLQKVDPGIPELEFFNPRYIKAVFQNKEPGVFTVRPYRMNERLSIQQGMFVVPGDLSKGFEANLETFLDTSGDNRVWKIEIPKCERLKALADLNRMNINVATLFPGIDGFIQSLSFDAEINMM